MAWKNPGVLHELETGGEAGVGSSRASEGHVCLKGLEKFSTTQGTLSGTSKDRCVIKKKFQVYLSKSWERETAVACSSVPLLEKCQMKVEQHISCGKKCRYLQSWPKIPGTEHEKACQ